MKSILTIALTTITLATLIGCGANDSDTSVTCSGVEISFSNEVNPIIKNSCATSSSCHATGSTRGPGALLTYAQIYSARTDIKSAVKSGRMPESGSLTSSQKNTIVCWIENGAQNN